MRFTRFLTSLGGEDRSDNYRFELLVNEARIIPERPSWMEHPFLERPTFSVVLSTANDLLHSRSE